MLLFSLSAQSVTLLSNLGNTTDGGYGGNPDLADNFITGSETLRVAAVNVLWETVGTPPAVNEVIIYTDDRGWPCADIMISRACPSPIS